MTDVPPDNGATGAQPAQPWDPSGIRRSNFTPPPPNAEPPTFDDDALADAMAAEVSPYTSEIKLPHSLPPEGAEFGGPPSEDATPQAPVAETTPAVPQVPVVDAMPAADPVPLVEPGRFIDSSVSSDTFPMPAANGIAAPPSPGPADDEELRRAIGGASTLEAMERLELEFRRLSNGEPSLLDAPVSPEAVAQAATAEPAAPAETTGSDEDVFSWLSAATVAAVPEAPPEDVVAPDLPAPSSPAFDLAAPESEPVAPDAPNVPAFDLSSVFDIPGAVVEAPAPEEVVAAPLPGTDALGWNRPAPIEQPPIELAPIASEPVEPAPIEPEPSAILPAPPEPAAFEPEPEAPALPPEIGTEIWSLFPDEDAAIEPVPDQSVFELPAPTAAPEPPNESPAPPPESAPAPEAFAWLFPSSTADVASIDDTIVPFAEPVSDDPDGEPVAFESLASATAAIPVVSWQPPQVTDPVEAAEPVVAPESSAFPGLPPVDESLIDPDAAAAAAAASQFASIPAPLPTAAPVEALLPAEPPLAAEPLRATAPPEDGVWDLGAAEPTPEPAPETFVDAMPPNPGIAAAAAAAAMVAATPLLPPAGAPVPPSTGAQPILPVPAPPPTVLPPTVLPPSVVSSDSGPQFGVPVPVSTEPPVGPESPDWLAAPPPSYTPPQLVEPPQFVDTPVNPALDPVSPITANTMARLPVPPPSERPNLADRAELPPPPGYEDIPIMSSDAAAQSTTFAPVLFAPAMSAPVAPSVLAAPPLLPVPPTAAPFGETPDVEPSESTSHDEQSEPGDPDMATPDPTVSELFAAPIDVVAGTDLVAGTDVPAAPVPDTVVVAHAMPQATESATLDDEDDDAIDEVDRVGTATAIPVAAASAVEPLAPRSEPIATARLGEDEPAIVDEKPKVSALEVESAGVEPTALDLRTGRAARLFWLWFAANSSVVSLGLGAVLLGTGMSLRQSIVATLAGVAISFLPLGLGTLAGKWSGQPTMIVSRAAFGHAGNILPAALAVITRVFWGGALLWLLATAVAQVLVGAGLDAGLGTRVWQLVGLVVGFVIATVVAVFGYGFVARLQLVLSIVNALLIIGVAALTFQHLDFARALTVPDGSWVLAIGGAAIVFSVIGLAWVHSSSDLARYQRPGSSGGASMLWATFGATLPPFLLICWGAMLAASDPSLATAMQTNPLGAIATLLPAWYPIPLLAAAALGLLSGAVLTIYSSGFAVQALGVKLRRNMTTLLSAILVLAAGAALLFLVPDFAAVARSLVITLAVPVAAWAGIFASEMMIRTRRFHTTSLLTPGGIYPQVRWPNLIALIVISAVSYGFVTSNVLGLTWQGYLFTAMGVAPGDALASSNVGVFVALVLGILVPLAGGISVIRRQEAAGQEAAGQAAPVAVAATPITTAPVVTAAPGPFVVWTDAPSKISAE